MAAITVDYLQSAIKDRLEATHVEVVDVSGELFVFFCSCFCSFNIIVLCFFLYLLTKLFLMIFAGGCGQAFEVVIVSPLFTGKNKLMRHRTVNKALKTEIESIHAFTQVRYHQLERIKYIIGHC